MSAFAFGHSPHDAQDLTQEFFCRLLEKNWLSRANPAKGRLRTFLITALKRFMAKEWRRASAQKRGAGRVHVPIGCFDQLRGLQFSEHLKKAGISLTTDVKSLKPEDPAWNRRLGP